MALDIILRWERKNAKSVLFVLIWRNARKFCSITTNVLSSLPIG